MLYRRQVLEAKAKNLTKQVVLCVLQEGLSKIKDIYAYILGNLLAPW